MFEKYHQLATYCLYLSSNGENSFYSYILPFSNLFAIITFIVLFIWGSIDKDNKTEDYNMKNFFLLLSGCICMGMIGWIAGVVLSYTWSIILFYICPIFLFLALMFFRIKFINYIKSHSKKSKKIIKDTMKELKAEELAKQAWENLKKDFPDIKYETVLENIKSKM